MWLDRRKANDLIDVLGSTMTDPSRRVEALLQAILLEDIPSDSLCMAFTWALNASHSECWLTGLSLPPPTVPPGYRLRINKQELGTSMCQTWGAFSLVALRV